MMHRVLLGSSHNDNRYELWAFDLTRPKEQHMMLLTRALECLGLNPRDSGLNILFSFCVRDAVVVGENAGSR